MCRFTQKLEISLQHDPLTCFGCTCVSRHTTELLVHLHSLWHCSQKPALTRVRDRPGKTQQTGIFCGKSFIAYIFRSKSVKPPIAYIFRSQSARAQSKSSIVYIFRSKRASPKPKKESETPSLLRRVILCLGRITP